LAKVGSGDPPYFALALAFLSAQIFFWAAAILALVAALNLRLTRTAEARLIFAHLAFCAARILAMPWRLNFFLAGATADPAPAASNFSNSLCSFSICSLILAARHNSTRVRFAILIKFFYPIRPAAVKPAFCAKLQDYRKLAIVNFDNYTLALVRL
jgi:hypothetical protein